MAEPRGRKTPLLLICDGWSSGRRGGSRVGHEQGGFTELGTGTSVAMRPCCLEFPRGRKPPFSVRPRHSRADRSVNAWRLPAGNRFAIAPQLPDCRRLPANVVSEGGWEQTGE